MIESTTRISNIAQRFDAGKQYPELLISNYDTHEEGILSRQLTLFDDITFACEESEKILKEHKIIYCFDTVEPDEGGVIGYYKTLTSIEADAGKYAPAFETKECKRNLGLSDDEDDYDEDDDYEDEFEDELDEPLVERDFEG